MAILPKLEPPVLPSGYVELEYVEQPLGNSGYFKTGLTPSNTLEFEIGGVTYDTISATSGQYGCLFGSRTSATYEYQLNTFKDTGTSRLGTMRVGTNAYSAGLVKNQEFEAYTDDTTYSFNGTETEITRDFADASPAEIYVFAFNVADGGTDRVRQNGHGKIKCLRFKNNGEYVRIYVPCRNKAGTVGFYDTVNDTFNPSLATAFVGGPIVMRRPLTVGISQKIIDIQVIKEDLRDAINGHYNSDVLDYYDGLVDYADAIDGITGSQRVLPTEPSVVNFIDYDGTLLYAYTAAEFQALDGMPPDPFHSGLIAQGWNWTRKEILDYLNRAPRIDVGQMYITNDGATRYYIHKTDPDYLNQALILYQGKANGVLVDWGDGTTYRRNATGTALLRHEYATTGDYIISLLPDDDCTFQLTDRADAYTAYTYNDNTIFGKYYTTAGTWVLMQECYKVELGKGLTGISPCAFRYFSNLKSISIPKNIGTFGAGCFYLCAKLKCIVCPRNTVHPLVTRERTFGSLPSLKYICTTPIWSNTFSGGSSFSSSGVFEYILIPDACTSAGGSEMFRYCYGLKSIYISKCITYLNSRLIGDCINLKRLDVSSVTSFSSYALSGCYSLQYIKFIEGVTSIPTCCIFDCHSLYEIDLPSTITTIAAQAFNNCFNVRRIIIRATTPPTLGNVNAFYGAYVTKSGASYRSTSDMGHFYVPYSEDHSVLQAYINSSTSTSWGYYYTTYGCPFTELNSNGTIPEEDYF